MMSRDELLRRLLGPAGPELTCILAGSGGSGRGLSASLVTNIHVQASAPPSAIVVKRKTQASTRATLPGCFDFAIS